MINYFDSSPSMSEHSLNLLDSPLHKDHPRHHTSFYNPRDASDSDSDTDSDSHDNNNLNNNNDDDFLRDQSPDLNLESDNHTIRSRTRSLKGYLGPKRWPERLKADNSSSSGMGTVASGSGSNSTTSLSGMQIAGEGVRQGSPAEVRGNMSDIGSEDLPMTKLSVSRNDSYDTRTLSPFVRPPSSPSLPLLLHSLSALFPP